MVKGRVDKKASTATGYAWVVWEKPGNGQTVLDWVPRCRKTLERDGDYIQSPVTPKKNRKGQPRVFQSPIWSR
jgi:hypothetical protein